MYMCIRYLCNSYTKDSNSIIHTPLYDNEVLQLYCELRSIIIENKLEYRI